MRLSGLLSRPAGPDTGTVPLRRWLLWGLVAAAIVAGVVLYFRYERSVLPLVA